MQQTQKYRKATIPHALRRTVWNTYIGEDIGSTECYVGCKTKITQLTFECGHVKAESMGGLLTLDNLRPICSSCNRSMGIKNMHDFMKSYGFKGDIIEENNNKNNNICIVDKPKKEITMPKPSPKTSCSLVPIEPINYFIENCIEYKKGKKIYLDDMYRLFIDFCPAFCDKEIVKSITMKQFIDYFIDNFYEVKYNVLYGYKFKYEIDETTDEEDEFFDMINKDKEMNKLKL